MTASFDYYCRALNKIYPVNTDIRRISNGVLYTVDHFEYSFDCVANLNMKGTKILPIPKYEDVIQAIFLTITFLTKKDRTTYSQSKKLGFYIWDDQKSRSRFIGAFYTIVYDKNLNVRLLDKIDQIPQTIVNMTIDEMAMFLSIRRKSVKSATKLGLRVKKSKKPKKPPKKMATPLPSSVQPPSAPSH